MKKLITLFFILISSISFAETIGGQEELGYVKADSYYEYFGTPAAFGLKWGMKKTDFQKMGIVLEKFKEDKPNKYQKDYVIRKLKNQPSDTYSFKVTIDNDEGLVFIHWQSKELYTRFDSQQRYNELFNTINQKYQNKRGGLNFWNLDNGINISIVPINYFTKEGDFRAFMNIYYRTPKCSENVAAQNEDDKKNLNNQF